MWAAHYRERAAECAKLAEASFEEEIEAHYRYLAERYIKLAEAEEAYDASHPELEKRVASQQ